VCPADGHAEGASARGETGSVKLSHFAAGVTRCSIGPDAAGPITLARVAGRE